MTDSPDVPPLPPTGATPPPPPPAGPATPPPPPSAAPATPPPPPSQAAPASYPPPPGSVPPPAGHMPAPTGYVPVPPGFYLDPQSNLVFPNGVQLAPRGRRVGAYFLMLLLIVVTLGIGYFIWGLIAWSKGTSPAFQVLGLKVYQTNDRRLASWGTMALRNIVGYIAQSILSVITLLVSFILFLTRPDNRSLQDLVASTVVVTDPGKVLG